MSKDKKPTSTPPKSTPIKENVQKGGREVRTGALDSTKPTGSTGPRDPVNRK